MAAQRHGRRSARRGDWLLPALAGALLCGLAGCPEEQSRQESDRELGELRRERKELARQLDEAKAEAKGLDAKSKALIRQCDAKAFEADDARRNEADALRRAAELRLEVDRLRSQLNSLQDKNQVLLSRVDELTKVNDLFRRQVEGVPSDSTANSPATSQADLLQMPTSQPDWAPPTVGAAAASQPQEPR